MASQITNERMAQAADQSQTQNVIAKEIAQVHLCGKVTGPVKGNKLNSVFGHQIMFLE